jgi:CheY-like chemotaxis protein
MKILVLEYSPMARRIIGEEFLSSGFEVINAETVEKALNILVSVPDISLITTGVALDGGDGFEFIRNLQSPEMKKQLKPMGNDEVPVILVTSNDTDKDRLKGYQVGASDFIQKPWSQGHLLAHVESVLGQDDELAGLSVLVADDSPTARTFISNCISRLGVTIHEANDGDQALEFLKNHEVDLVVTDLNMPNMGGDTLCLKIRGELGLKDLPVIFLSGNEDRETIISLFKMGATDYLKKPFLQEELMARLRVHLEREKLMQALREESEIESNDLSWWAEAKDETPEKNHCGEKQLRILLVDDGPVNLIVGSKILRRHGCLVQTATNGKDAIANVEASLANQPFDMIFMDLMMEGINGLEATRRIREMEDALPLDHPEHKNPVPIIALSAAFKKDKKEECLKAGMNDFHAKPMKSGSILSVIERWTKAPV